MKTCYIYTRTAVVNQSELKNNHIEAIELQKLQCLNYAKTHDYSVLKIFEDLTSGRYNTNRVGLQSLLKACKRHAVDTVLITRIDRLSRTPTNFKELFQYFKKNGIKLIPVLQEDSTPTISITVTLESGKSDWGSK